MAEFRKLPTQAELQNMLFMEQMRVKNPQQIAQEALASGTTVTPMPENVFQKIAGGAGIAKEYVNRAGSAADLAKLFPGYKPETKVTIPTGYNFAPKQAPTGEIIPGGLQTQNVNLGQVLQAIKPADVLGLTGFEKAYTDVGLGKAPQPLDVLDVAGLGVTGLVGGKAAAKGMVAAGKYAAPEVGRMAEEYAIRTGLLNPLTAYHGSPAKFEKFDISKVGTGEGQQVYGYGMYFAENPKVAEGYRMRLAGGTDPYTYEWQGTKYEQGAKPDPITHALSLSYHQGTKVAKDIAKQGLVAAKKGEPFALEMGGEDYYKKMLDTASKIKKKDIKAKQGAFYTVDIPDESIATFIDWNKPVPDELRNRLSPIAMKQFDTGVSGTSGEALYKDLMFSFKMAGSQNPAKDASNWLNANGVEGIKYKDAGSRTTKGGTNNFVVFDPSKVKILQRD